MFAVSHETKKTDEKKSDGLRYVEWTHPDLTAWDIVLASSARVTKPQELSASLSLTVFMETFESDVASALMLHTFLELSHLGWK